MILNTIQAANKLRERDLKIDKYKFLKQAWNKFAKKSAATWKLKFPQASIEINLPKILQIFNDKIFRFQTCDTMILNNASSL